MMMCRRLREGIIGGFTYVVFFPSFLSILYPLRVNAYTGLPLKYLAASHASLPRWVVTKLGKALVDVGKVSWPQEDPDFLTELMQMARCAALNFAFFFYDHEMNGRPATMPPRVSFSTLSARLTRCCCMYLQPARTRPLCLSAA